MNNDTPDTSKPATIEEDLAQSIISILETTNSPEIQRAREIIAYRLAISGDVAPSRIPAPRNITEIGGYINLLSDYGEVEQRSRMIAAALGIAGPQVNLPQPGTLPPLSFSSRNQVRPEGAQQATFQLSFTIRSDFVAAFDAATQSITALGGAMPILSGLRQLPAAGTTTPAAGDEQLNLIGRMLILSPTAALREVAVDPLSLSRPDAGGAFQLMARVINDTAPDASTVSDADWISWECDIDQCSEVATTDARFALTPILNTAGWHQLAPIADPTSVNEMNGWNRWRNITGIVPGQTRFGDELQLLYSAAELVSSPVFDQLDLIWNGNEFAAS